MLSKGWENVHRILAIQLDEAINLVTPALQTLHQAFPDARITLMTTPTSSRSLPGTEDVLLWDFWHVDFKNLNPALVQALIDQICSYQFDVAVIFNNTSQSPYPLAYICYLAGIPIRLGQSKEFGGSVLSHWVKSPADDPNRHLFLLESVGLIRKRHLNTAVLSVDAGLGRER